jgi:hypothetical protein
MLYVLPEGTQAPLFVSAAAGSPAADPASSVPDPLSPATHQHTTKFTLMQV